MNAYQCKQCGELFPFDAAFDAAAIESGKVIERRDDAAINTCDTVLQLSAHIENDHPDMVNVGEKIGGESLMDAMFELVELAQA